MFNQLLTPELQGGESPREEEADGKADNDARNKMRDLAFEDDESWVAAFNLDNTIKEQKISSAVEEIYS